MAGDGTLRPRFWETVAPADMTPAEWEALCDGCARCCTVTLEDEETGELFATSVACRLLDTATCRCSDYPDRLRQVPHCIQVTPQTIASLDWFPETCGYRRVAAGRPLPDWHWLICGDREAVHRSGPSLRGRMVSETEAGDEPERFILGSEQEG